MVFSPDLGGKNGGVLSMRMQVILDSPFARPGSAPKWRAGRKESSGTGLDGPQPTERLDSEVHLQIMKTGKSEVQTRKKTSYSKEKQNGSNSRRGGGGGACHIGTI